MEAFTIILLLFLSITANAATEYFGEFIGEVRTQWLEPDKEGQARKMKLLEDFGYKDKNGKIWTAPKGTIIDGASIPRFLWTPIGSPFTGDYRKASVVHDYYCETRTEEWEAVHKMFYEACLAGGVDRTKAKILYAGVYVGGPRWKTVHYANHDPRFENIPGDIDSFEKVSWQTQYKDEDFARLKDWIEKNDPSIDKIKNEASKIVSQDEPPDHIRYPRQ